MTPLSVWQWLIVMVLVMTMGNGFIAQHKGRSALGWIILGLMFNPIAFVVPAVPALSPPAKVLAGIARACRGRDGRTWHLSTVAVHAGATR